MVLQAFLSQWKRIYSGKLLSASVWSKKVTEHETFWIDLMPCDMCCGLVGETRVLCNLQSWEAPALDVKTKQNKVLQSPSSASNVQKLCYLKNSLHVPLTKIPLSFFVLVHNGKLYIPFNILLSSLFTWLSLSEGAISKQQNALNSLRCLSQKSSCLTASLSKWVSLTSTAAPKLKGIS